MTPRLLFVATSALVLAACTTSHVDDPTLTTPPSLSPTATAPAEIGPSPCTRVSNAQITAAFGGGVTPGRQPAPATRAECDWHVTGSNVGADGAVELYYPPVQSSVAFAAAKAGLPGAIGVAGIGADAYYLPSLSALAVLVDDAHQFTVQAIFAKANPAAVQAAVTAVARNAAASY